MQTLSVAAAATSARSANRRRCAGAEVGRLEANVVTLLIAGPVAVTHARRTARVVVGGTRMHLRRDQVQG